METDKLSSPQLYKFILHIFRFIELRLHCLIEGNASTTENTSKRNYLNRELFFILAILAFFSFSAISFFFTCVFSIQFRSFFFST